MENWHFSSFFVVQIRLTVKQARAILKTQLKFFYRTIFLSEISIIQESLSLQKSKIMISIVFYLLFHELIYLFIKSVYRNNLSERTLFMIARTILGKFRSFAGKVYQTFLWGITMAAAIMGGMVTIPRLVGVCPYVILSSSMEPAIQTGSLIFVNTRDCQAEKGDIVTFVMGNEERQVTVTHRIVRETEGGYITKGDGNQVEDPAVLTEGQILGTYAAGIPYAGYMIEMLTGKVGIVAAVWLAGLHMAGGVFSFLCETKPELRKDLR